MFKQIIMSVMTIVSCTIAGKPAITYSFSGGRFGDNIHSYCNARWLSYSKNLDFYYRPFKYSDKLTMHHSHDLLYTKHAYNKTVKIENVYDLPRKKEVLVKLDPFPSHCEVNWDNPTFFALVKKEIQPTFSISPIEKPKGALSVALHVRRGGGWDIPLYQIDTIRTAEFVGPIIQNPEEYQCSYKERKKFDCLFEDLNFPMRFAPDSYYIQQLNYVAELFPEKKLYVHLFTDDPRPDLIAKKFERQLDNSRITFGYRTKENRHDANVLDDFFNMMKFDILIRCASHFSMYAGILGRYKLEIRPESCRWEGRKLIITEIEIIERDNEAWKTKSRYVDTDRLKIKKR